jgi:hypothetical protein
MKPLKKLRYNLSILWHSLFRGMANADSIIKGQPGVSSDDVGIIREVGGGGVFADMLEQKETQQVVEMRDKYYRVLKEADKWDTSSIQIIGESEDGVIFGNTDGIRKKTKIDFMKHPPVYNPQNLTIRTIQDNKHIQKKNNLIGGYNAACDSELFKNINDFDVTLTVTRDEFTPRFQIDKYTKRIVVRNNDNRAIVDFYLPSEASQFGKVDAILIANLHRIKDENILRSDLTDFLTIEWYSDKAWNSDDVCHFKYDDIKFIGADIFDGSFVLSFDCNVVENGTDLSEKFRTKELDEKYSNEDQKQDAVDIFAYARRSERMKEKNKEIDTDNLSNTTLKLS